MFRSPCAVGLGGALALAILAKGPAAIEARAQFQTTPTVFSGQATVVSGKVLGLPVTLVDTGTVAPDGGKLEAHLICYPAGAANCTLGLPDATNGALGVEVLNATVVAQGHNSHARASVADLTINAAGQSISATFLEARAAAQCANGQASVQAESVIAELVINGDPIVVSGAVNQRIDLPAVKGFVLINEQIGSASGSAGDLTVSALHIVIPALVPGSGTDTDLAIAKAHADIQCGVKFCPSDKDFVTGGGWDANPRRNFAVAGGNKNGGLWGHLLFIDHSTGMKVKGTGVTAYVIETGTTRRHIEGTCDINGSPGTYQADVDDQGEPGVNDTLTLTLTPNGGMPVTVADGTIAGGNIQLHTCK
jgi:hypothetical protein